MLRTVVVSSVLAAGLAVAAPVLAEDGTNSLWSGPYVGINLGYGGGDFHYPFSGTTDVAGANPVSGKLRQSSSGVIGGVQAGYNYRLPYHGLVVGLETDFDPSDVGGSVNGNSVVGGADSSGAVASRIDNLGTVRARIGMPMMGGRVMPYVTGGFAYGGVKPLTETACAACLTGDTPNDYAKTQTGWTVGGGAEVPLSRRLSLKAEYLYVNLGAAQIGAPGGEINTPGFGPLYNAFLAESMTANIIRVGLNYHF